MRVCIICGAPLDTDGPLCFHCLMARKAAIQEAERLNMAADDIDARLQALEKRYPHFVALHQGRLQVKE